MAVCMSSSLCVGSQAKAVNATRAFKSVRCSAVTGRGRVTVQASVADGQLGRREATAAALATVTALFGAAPAKAFLGFGEDRNASYQEETATVITQVLGAIAMDKGDPNKESAVAEVRKLTNAWVAKYRRDTAFSGRASFGNTYSALSALAGHYNSFGPTAALPKKRLDRITTELNQAKTLLSRNR